MTGRGKRNGSATGRHPFTRLGRGFRAGMMLLTFFVHGAAAQAQSAPTPIELAGRDVAEGLQEAAQCTPDRKVRVGIWPFDSRTIPLDAPAARALDAAFLRGFQRAEPRCFDSIDVAAIGPTLAQLHSSGTDWAAGAETLAALEEELGRVDYVVAGQIYEEGDQLVAEYKATARRTGHTAMRAGPVPIPETLADGTCGGGAITLDRAIDEIAAKLAGAAPGMTRLVVEGGYFENTGGRTELSQHIEALIVPRIAAVHAAADGADDLTVHWLQDANAGALRKYRGIALTPREIAEAVSGDETPGDPAGTYRLSFRYWLCDTTARLMVKLQGADGVPHDWVGNIRLGTIPDGVALRPPQPVERPDWAGAPLALHLTGPRGPNPTYRVGELLETGFTLEDDSWLFCFFTAADGETVQVLPNALQTRPDAHFYEGGRLHLFPDPDRLPEPDRFSLEVTGETFGIETLRCFATSRDVRADLPEALQGRSTDPVPPRYATRLPEVFQSVEGTAVTTGAMTITVVE